MDSRKLSVGLRIAIVLGIAFLFPMTVYYGVAAFAEQPDYPSYSLTDPDPTQEQQQEAQQRYDSELESYNAGMEGFAMTLFWVATPFGFAALVLGAFRGLSDIGTGFLLGGIATLGLVQAEVSQYLNDQLRFASLLIGLALLVAISWRRLRDTEKGPTRA